MSTNERKQRITDAFSAKAGGYDAAADVQWMVVRRLSERIEMARLPSNPRILEIGCGTGFLSVRLKALFPESDLILTDIAQSMLDRCRQRVGDGPTYRVLDGEMPTGIEGPFDLIVASLAFQWFVDLKGGLERLCPLLGRSGRMMFATLGRKTFSEWRAAHARFGYECGTPEYPGIDDFPFPAGFQHRMEEDLIRQPYDDGADFARSLKALGAGEPVPGRRPLSTGAFRKLLASLETGFTATYHVLYGEIGPLVVP